ncbi:hypothetical protein GCM10010123_22630 [Pilimelia anulata]|uniref:HD domain-containing protein n=1 Tax=Pilimelia anulata TaxID=53371 RepID=A0A8J3B383_9ACTN|nr:HD domain-containing protein [Pilimelia anulata]GGJ92279.1 hypothetical protein GCM10010123_22630 [Pilimelia anulata]
MYRLTRPDVSPLIRTAAELSREWCAGHVIDGAPAYRHAAAVALKLEQHMNASDELVAAALLHDAPCLAPVDVDLDAVLTRRFGAEVTRIVRALETEHIRMEAATTPAPLCGDLPVLHASAADKIISVGGVVRRALAADHKPTYWATRKAFVRRIPYFRAFGAMAAAHLPSRMARELHHVVSRAHAMARRNREPGSAACGVDPNPR